MIDMMPNAMTLAGYCEDVYKDPVLVSVGQLHANLVGFGDYAVVSFRGSASILDWWVDFQWIPKNDTRLGYVHRGFLDDVSGAFDKLRDAIGSQDYVLTGHSKGGAEALIFGALMCAYKYKKPTKIVTFGAPKAGFVGLPLVLGYADVKVIQYRNGGDPVPFEPRFPGEFCHCAPIEHIGPTRSTLEPLDHLIVNYYDNAPNE